MSAFPPRTLPLTSSTPANTAAKPSSFARVSLLPELILRRMPYRIAIRKLDTPLCRDLALALPGQAHISAATRQFLRYLDRRNAPAAPVGRTGFDNRQ